MSRNFFEEFIKNDFFEKKASENENIKSTLGSITPSVLEKLAEEIGALSEEEDMTLEQKLASEEETETKEEVKEEAKEEEKEAETEKEEEAKEEVKEEKEAETDKEEEAKEEPKEEVKEEKDAETSCGEEKEEKEEPKEDKEAEGCSEEEIKKAYEVAEQKLASAGLTVADYVFDKVANEVTALFVTENAEKLASLSDKSTLQVADEILTAMAEKLG